ncbi:mRNA-capping enzyme [Anaeramoeba flamelloides]|uniref:mRNA guanylyltransferase n=1 Tax=Anaeramoeba flamelloides TaxID=1746091 RepID=A0ABQ8ZEI4_9EUKA|nr:mRNA-capping enzyme [Anaeramoeba flamelloides]
MLIKNQNEIFRPIGLVIDLTNSKNYYDPKVFTNKGIQHKKIFCKGHLQVPTNKSVGIFIRTVQQFKSTNPNLYIACHCTHGYNRTGYMIIRYLLKLGKYNLYQCINLFKQSRYPGIYKIGYLESLFKFSLNTSIPKNFPMPKQPFRKRNQDKHDLNKNKSLSKIFNHNKSKINIQIQKKLQIEIENQSKTDTKPENNDHIQNLKKISVVDQKNIVTIPQNIFELIGERASKKQESQLRKFIGDWFNRTPYDPFPGSHPVSLDALNMRYLSDSNYYVTWKADGVRCMLLIISGACFLVDRNFKFYNVYLSFPGVIETLLDGEMVLEKIKKNNMEIKTGKNNKSLKTESKAEKSGKREIGKSEGNGIEKSGKNAIEGGGVNGDLSENNEIEKKMEIKDNTKEDNEDENKNDIEKAEMKTEKIVNLEEENEKGNETEIEKEDSNIDEKLNNEINEIKERYVFLVYDLMYYQTESYLNYTLPKRLGAANFMISNRNKTVSKEKRDSEPFEIRFKEMYHLKYTKTILHDLYKQLNHETDGLIFTPVDEAYSVGTCESLLKWKPPYLNTVDFAIRESLLTNEKTATLNVLSLNREKPVNDIIFESPEEKKKYLNKIVECSFDLELKNWKILRIRYDKLHPNGFSTYQSIIKSIFDRIKEEDLLKCIETIDYEKINKENSSENNDKN